MKEPYGYFLADVLVEAWVEGDFYAYTFTATNGVYSVAVPPGKVTLWFYDLDMPEVGIPRAASKPILGWRPQ